MRLRLLVVLVFVLLCLGMVGRTPAAHHRTESARDQLARAKVFPVALRYRQQLDQQVLLPAPPPPAPAPRTAGGPPGRSVARASSPFATTALLSLLARLQP
jgi:hypothetical protein